MQSIDLSVDFADWSEAGLEVKNTFLHVCSPLRRKSVKSDSICNYTLYSQPGSESESLPTASADNFTAESESESLPCANAENVTAEKSKNKRPGKKARARIQKRSNRHDTLASIASVSTEASSDQDIQSPRSEHQLGIQPATLCSGGLSGFTFADADHTSTPPHVDIGSTFVELPLSELACVATEALVELQAQDFDMTQQVAAEVKQSLQMEAEKSEPDVLPERREVVERTALVASSFLFGALFVTALLVLLWSTGVVQIQVAQGTMEPCHKNELKAFKEDIEARLAFHERRLQDVAEITETMPSQQQPVSSEGIEAELGSKERKIKEAADTMQTMPIQRQPVAAGLPFPTSGSNIVRGRAARPVAAAPEFDLSSSGASHEEADKPLGNLHEQDVASLDGSARGWLAARSLCCVWLSLVFFCSMAQVRAPWMMNTGSVEVSNPDTKEPGLSCETGSEKFDLCAQPQFQIQVMSGPSA